MGYASKQVGKLNRLINANKLPALEMVDWIKIYKYWVKNNEVKVRRYARGKPKQRFYTRAFTANSRARKLNVVGALSAEDLEEVYAKFKGACKNCGTKEHLVFDHTKSMYRGGDNTKENLQLLCRLCNMEKGVNE